MKIYTVTAGRFYTRELVWYMKNGKRKAQSIDPDTIFSDRDFGFFPTFEEAEKAVLANSCDFYETNNTYACISEVQHGMYTNSYIGKGLKVFYEWEGTEEDGGYIRADGEPEHLREYYEGVIGYMEPFG